MPVLATILGQSPSSLGTTLALLITFVGIGVVANALIIYAIVQVFVERRQNLERRRSHEPA